MKYLSAISVILISGILLTGCSSKTEKKDEPGKTSGTTTESVVIPVKIMTLAKTKIARTIDYTATILPFEEVNMAPSTPGRIDKIYVEVGYKVNKGDDLFLMDRTQLYQLKLQLSSTAKDLSRLDTLLRYGSAKQQDYDQLKTQYDVTKTNIDFMEENTLMKSPFTGVVTGKYYEDGEMYSGTPTTLTGRSAIVTVMQIDPLKVNVGISEQFYPLIKKGMKASVISDIYADEVFTGSVFRVAPTINSATRSFNVEIKLPNRNNMLKPGMFARVSMDLGEVETFVVPANTVLVQEGTNMRYVFIEENGISRRVDVTLGKRFDDKIEITSDDLSEGVHLITEGQSRLLTGNNVEVVE